MLPIHLLYTFTYLYAMVTMNAIQYYATVIVTRSNTQVYMAYIFVQGI